MDFSNDDLLYLLGRKTAEVERLTAINQAQANEIKRLNAEQNDEQSKQPDAPEPTPEE